MSEQQMINELCANNFAAMKGDDRPEFVVIEDHPISKPMRDWLQNNPLYPTVFVFENGVETYVTVKQTDPGFRAFLTVVVNQSSDTGCAVRVAPNDTRTHPVKVFHPKGMSVSEAARRAARFGGSGIAAAPTRKLQ